MRSLRASLITGSVLGTVGVLAIASVAIYRGARDTLLRQFDEGLADNARVLASTARVTPGGFEVELEGLDLPEFTTRGGRGYAQVWVGADSVLYRSPSLEGRDLEAATPTQLDRPAFRWIHAGAKRRTRAVDLRFEPQVDAEDYAAAGRTPPPGSSGGMAHLVVALEPTEIDAFLDRLKVLLAAVGALSGLSVAGILAAVVRRSLRPLDRLAGEIGRLSDDDLSSRFSVPATPRELEPVVDQLNQLLARLDLAFQRERTFGADIAHELRTPLAGLRSTVEVTLSRTRGGKEYRETLDGMLVIIRRVQAMVETLLYLGRLEAGQVEIERAAADLGEIAEASWQPLVETARSRKLAVTWNAPRGVEVVTDPILLEVAIRNLLDNAVTYADEAGYIKVEVGEERGERVLRVVNSGSNVSQNDVEELMRPFARADRSRPASGGHFGLGLALAGKIAGALHCAMYVESRVGGEFIVRLSMRNDRASRGV